MSDDLIVGHDRSDLKLATRHRDIPNQFRNDTAPESKIVSIQMRQKSHPGAIFRSISGTYNCVGMLFGSRRTCIDPSQVEMILEDDQYYEVPRVVDTAIGDIVVYRGKENEVSHVGLIVEKRLKPKTGDLEIWVLSKWGREGEYVHELNDFPDGPAMKHTHEFWSERKDPRIKGAVGGKTQ